MFHSFDHLKLALAAFVGLVAAVTDAAGDMHGWEDVSLKALLIAALVFIGRLLLQQQREHKIEMREAWEAHKKDSADREERNHHAIANNTQCLAELASLTREQTDYFKAVTRNVVDEKFKSKPQLPG
jgi:hypothetical protein